MEEISNLRRVGCAVVCHKLQRSQHARVRPATQLRNKSTNSTWKNFNEHIRHPFTELRLTI